MRGLLRIFLLVLVPAFPPVPAGSAPPAPLPSQGPIVMVHGALATGGVYRPFKSWLVKHGFPPHYISSADYDWTDCLEGIAGEIGEEVERLRRDTGFDRVVMMCHSLGCGAALSYLNLQGGDRYVSHLITIAGDNYGAYPRPWGLLSCAVRQMTPYWSAYVERMFSRGELRPGVKYCALQAEEDWVLPRSTTDLAGAKKVMIPNVGHASIVREEATFRAVAKECLPRPMEWTRMRADGGGFGRFSGK